MYPKTHYVTPRERILDAIEKIKAELVQRREYFIKEHKLLEEQRITQRTQFDIEMMNELGIAQESKTIHVTFLAEMKVNHLRHYLIICRLMRF